MYRHIGITGLKGAGKDTLADAIMKFAPYRKVSYADPLKKMLGELFGFSNEQLYGSLKEVVDPFWKTTPREVMQRVGTDLFRVSLSELFPNTPMADGRFWVSTKNRLRDDRPTIVADVRFEDEAALVREMGGMIVKIVSVREGSSIGITHISETSDVTPDVVIHNDGTIDDLVRTAKVFIEGTACRKPVSQ